MYKTKIRFSLLKEIGYSEKIIAEKYGVALSTIYRLLKKIAKTETKDSKVGSGIKSSLKAKDI